MNGDAEHPLSFRFEPRRQGPHVVVGVWAGNRDAGRGNCGTLTFREEEWAAFRLLVETAPITDSEQERTIEQLYGSIPHDLRAVAELGHMHAAVVLMVAPRVDGNVKWLGPRAVFIDEKPVEVDAFGLADA